MVHDIIKDTKLGATEKRTHTRWNFLKRREQPVAVLDAQHQLVDSITTGGLRSSTNLEQRGDNHLGSIDRRPSSLIFGRVLKPPDHYRNGTTFQRALEQALYMGDNSILPVITERASESATERQLIRSTQSERGKISRRAAASFLVVCPSPTGADMTRTEEQTTPDQFAYVLFPQEVLDGYNTDAIASKGIKVKSVGNVTRRLLQGDRVTVPDYEAALKDIMKEFNAPIWIHGVRLPLEEDLHDIK